MRTIAIACMVLSACGVRVLEPAPAPPRTMPRLPEDVPPAEPGTTPVLIDSMAVPAKVFDEVGRDICLTPCVVNLAPGVHDLEFVPIDRFSDRVGKPSISVVARPLVFRYELGLHESHDTLRSTGMAMAITASVVAASAIPVALIPQTRAIGIDLELAATAGLVAGIVMVIAGRDVVQMGAGTQWSPAPPGS
jgi:hypothetical protein